MTEVFVLATEFFAVVEMAETPYERRRVDMYVSFSDVEPYDYDARENVDDIQYRLLLKLYYDLN